MRRKDYRDITGYALLYQYPNMATSLLVRVQRSVLHAERFHRGYWSPEYHALQVPFAKGQESIELVQLYYQELLLRLADAGTHHQNKRVIQAVGQCLHLLQDLADHTDLISFDKEYLVTAIPDIVCGKTLSNAITLSAAPAHTWMHKEKDTLSLPKERNDDERAGINDLALRLSISFLVQHRNMIDRLLFSQIDK